MSATDYSEEAVTRRLRDVEHLRRDQHAVREVDYSEEAVTRRLREVEQLRRLCDALGSTSPKA